MRQNVVVKDPLTWMDSMCRVSYTARFPKAKCCPSPVASTETIVNWVDGKPKSRYASLAKMWSDWNGAYFDSDSPRLMVRYEDLLFRTRETTKQICDCVGGTMTEKFDPIDQGAKYGSEHRMSLADAPGRKNSRRKYANETRRYGHLKGVDLEAIARDIDPRLLDAFRYAFSDARRREVVGDDAACSATSSRWRGH